MPVSEIDRMLDDVREGRWLVAAGKALFGLAIIAVAYWAAGPFSIIR
jgi:hypothetical protein